MATQLMDRPDRERLLRLMPSAEKITRKLIAPFIGFWATLCSDLVFEVKRLDGRCEVVQILRVLVIAHIFRFIQSTMAKIPPIYYLRKVLLLYDIPITASIAAFCTMTRILHPILLPFFLPPLFFLVVMIVIYIPKLGMEKELNEMIDQQNRDAADNSIPSTSNFSQLEKQDSFDIKVPDHFANILLAVICVDLLIQFERLKGTYNPRFLGYMVTVLASRHFPYFTQFAMGQNRTPPDYYLRKVLLCYDIPITAAIAAFYSIFRTFTITFVLAIFLQSSLLALLHISMYKRKELTKAKMLLWTYFEVVEQWLNNEHHINLTKTRRYRHAFSKWEKGKHIGSGQYGTVYVFKHSETGELCAVKELKIRENRNDKSIRQEVKILSKLKENRNIVKYYGHTRDEQGRICLYMEYIQQGSLYDYMEKNGKKLVEPLIRDFTAQILFGLVYLHSNKIVHRDIKSGNLLVDCDNTIKLVDFGLAKVLSKSVGKHSVKGTLCYAAPELLQNKEYKSSKEAYVVDIWSLGCVIIEMFSGEPPQWPTFDQPQPHPPIPEGLSKMGIDFLKRCFIRNPTERPSAVQLLEDPFVKSQIKALMKESTRINGVERC